MLPAHNVVHSISQDRAHRIGQSKRVVTYRLLTSGSVEIDMMKRQISKKKLERLTMQGGDYRKAGRREGQQQVTLTELKALLEDDVKNLEKREKEGHGIGGSRGRAKRGAVVVEAQVTDSGRKLKASAVAPVTDADWIQRDISDAELDMIMNRDLLFPLSHLSHKGTSNTTSAAGVKSVASCVSLQSSTGPNSAEKGRGKSPADAKSVVSEEDGEGDAVVLDYAEYQLATNSSLPGEEANEGKAVDAAVVAAWEAERDSAQLEALLGIALEGEMYDIVADSTSSRSILSSIK